MYNLYTNNAPETKHILPLFADNIFIYATYREETYVITMLQ